jgi:hypothetical protein
MRIRNEEKSKLEDKTSEKSVTVCLLHFHVIFSFVITFGIHESHQQSIVLGCSVNWIPIGRSACFSSFAMFMLSLLQLMACDRFIAKYRHGLCRCSRSSRSSRRSALFSCESKRRRKIHSRCTFRDPMFLER